MTYQKKYNGRSRQGFKNTVPQCCPFRCYLVDLIQSRRQTIRFELNTAKSWNNRWGFMRDAMIDKEQEYQRKTGLEAQKLPPIQTRPLVSKSNAVSHTGTFASGLPSRLGPGLTSEIKPAYNGSGETSDVLADWLSTYHVSRVITYRYPAEKYTMPPTTSNDIGWSWNRVQNKMGMPYKVDLPIRYETYEDMLADQKRKAVDVDLKKWQKEQAKSNVDTGDQVDIAYERPRMPAPHSLERFGKHARGRGDVFKWFGAREAMA